MTTKEAHKKLEKVKDLFDFQNLFFSEDENRVMTPDFDIEYEISQNNFTNNRAARIFDASGSCTNAYMKLEDGYIPYPF